MNSPPGFNRAVSSGFYRPEEPDAAHGRNSPILGTVPEDSLRLL
jgi:hypothetical protein